MRLISNRQLTGVYGTVGPNQAFECPDDVAVQLIANKLARKCHTPIVLYDSTVVKNIQHLVVEVDQREPFRHLPLSDSEQTKVVVEGSSVVQGAEV